MYDRGSEVWTLIMTIVDTLKDHGGVKKSTNKQLWGTFCRFFRQMLIAAKVHTAPFPFASAYNTQLVA